MHTLRTCSRRPCPHPPPTPPHPPRHGPCHYRRRGRRAVMDAVMKKNCYRLRRRRRRRRRRHSRACAMNCAEWRSPCPGISTNQITSTTNGLSPPISPSSHRHSTSFTPHSLIQGRHTWFRPRSSSRSVGCTVHYSMQLFLERLYFWSRGRKSDSNDGHPSRVFMINNRDNVVDNHLVFLFYSYSSTVECIR